jgi:histidine ammonia-lyase
MGANAATQAYSLTYNVERVLAIELMNASQAMHFRNPAKTSKFLNMFLKAYQVVVPFIKEDKFLHEDIVSSISFLKSVNIDNEVLFI